MAERDMRGRLGFKGFDRLLGVEQQNLGIFLTRLKTLLDRKLITTAGRKSVLGKPILYKTTKEFLIQFGLKDLNELPSLKEFEELRRLASHGCASRFSRRYPFSGGFAA